MPVPPIKEESRAFFKALGAHIAQLRKEQGMTQVELARALGVSQQTVFAYELGQRRVTVPMLAKLAKTFDIPVEELMGMAMPRQRRQRRSQKILRHAERMQQLSKTEQRFVIKIINTLLERNRSSAGASRERPDAPIDLYAKPGSPSGFARCVAGVYRTRVQTYYAREHG